MRRPSAGLLVGIVLLVLGSLLLLRVVEMKRGNDRRIGILADETTEVPTIEGTWERPAEEAGFAPGDRIVAINGEPIASWSDYDEAARGFRPGEEQSFLVERDGRPVTLTLRPGVGFAWGAFLMDLLILLSHLGIALLSLRHLEDLRARLLCFFSLAVALEFVLPPTSTGRPLVDLLAFNLFFLLTGLQMGLELHLASVIPERRDWLRRHPWVIRSFYGVGLASAAIVMATFTADRLGYDLLPWSVGTAETILSNVVMPVWAIGLALLLVRPALRHPVPQKRHQAALVFAGILPWTTVVVLSTVHALLGGEWAPWMDTAFSLAILCYPVAVFVAIFRYQLFDMELVVRRSLVYTALTTVLLVIFYAALGAGGVVASEFFDPGTGSIWVVAAATLLLGLLFTPLRRSIEGVIYRRFFPERVELRQRLTDLASELPALGKLPLMGDRLVTELGDILAVRSVSLLLADPRSGLLATLASTLPEREELEHSLLLSSDDPGLRLLTASGRPFSVRQLASKSSALEHRLRLLRAELVAPLVHQGRLVGLLLLGAKERREAYPAEEIDLLVLLAHHVAIVFENARLFESATRDSLTGLWRREAVLDQLEHELHRARRYGRPLAIGMADIDHFKEINDRYGHLAGDTLLKRVGQLLASGLRSTDFIGRYGGEEFLLVLPETELEGAVNVAEKVRGLVEEDHVLSDQGDRLTVTLSIGLASLDELGDFATGIESLIAAADRSLYLAKEEGRNRVRPTVA